MEKEVSIYMSKDEYAAYLKEIESYKIRLKKINSGRKEAFDAGAGDGWDSPEFEEIERQERIILGELQRRINELSKIVVVENHHDDEIIDIGDTLLVDLFFDPNDSEEMVFKLVGTVDNSSEIQQVSVNSPLGLSIYKKSLGGKYEYTTNGRKMAVLVKKKMGLVEEEKPSKKKQK